MSAEPIVQHTPGPWHVGGEMLTPAGTKQIADQHGNSIAYVLLDADGDLLSAAPDLLASLIEVVETVDFEGEEAPEKWRAAIAKATGGAR